MEDAAAGYINRIFIRLKAGENYDMFNQRIKNLVQL